MSETTPAKKRSRSKSETRRSTTGTSHPIVSEDEAKIKKMENPYNKKWELPVPLPDIKNTINNVKGHKRDQGSRTRWQTEALLRYLMFLDANLEEKMKIIDELEEISDQDDIDIGVGYKSVIFSLLARFNLEVHDNEKALLYLKVYNEIDSQIPGNISDHPEVLASKAFSLAFWSQKDSERVVELYQQALDEKPVERDWLFGLCLAMEKELRVPGENDDKRIRDLEKNLRKVIKIDQTHYQAKIVLAKRLVIKDAYEEQGQIFFHLSDNKTWKDIRELTESWKVIRENMFFFQKWLNFENVLKQNCNKI